MEWKKQSSKWTKIKKTIQRESCKYLWINISSIQACKKRKQLKWRRKEEEEEQPLTTPPALQFRKGMERNIYYRNGRRTLKNAGKD